MDIRTRKQNHFPTMSTPVIRNYFGADPQERAAARREILDQYGPSMKEVHRSLRYRFGYIAADVIQEAWVRCFGMLDTHRDDLLKPRPERPSTRKLMYDEAKRACATLEQRERRWWQRKVPVEAMLEPLGKAALAQKTETKLSASEVRDVIRGCWQQLIEGSDEEQRQVLDAVGAAAVYAGAWEPALAAEPVHDEPTLLLQLVVERRQRLSELLSEALRGHGLNVREMNRFIEQVLPGVKRTPKR